MAAVASLLRGETAVVAIQGLLATGSIGVLEIDPGGRRQVPVVAAVATPTQSVRLIVLVMPGG